MDLCSLRRITGSIAAILHGRLCAPSGIFLYHAPRMSFAQCFLMSMFICKGHSVCVCVRARACVCVCVCVMLPLSDIRKQITKKISVHNKDEIRSDRRKCDNVELLNLLAPELLFFLF
jgi:hypothetical protein